jgi:hypothetical protein
MRATSKRCESDWISLMVHKSSPAQLGSIDLSVALGFYQPAYGITVLSFLGIR